MSLPISAEPFTGRCIVCDDVAELRHSSTTALLQNMENHRLSAIGTKLVRCFSGDHAYFLLEQDSMVEDPFEEGELLDTSPLDAQEE